MDELLLASIRASVIGEDEVVVGPFGPRRVTYADYTASGRSLTFLEDLIRDAVLPLYANTHTESSGTGLQTTRFREDARAIIRDCVGATAEDHAVLFCGSGSTGAIDRLIRVLELRVPNDLDRRYGLTDAIPADERPVVFIGPFEHHSNELPWRESIADVVAIPEDADGHIDLDVLESRLVEFADRPLLIGSFSAASNVTGIISDTRAVSVLLHRHGALAFWDFAAAAPYVEIEMGPRAAGPGEDPADDDLDYKDAIVISTHKLIGGPGTPGLLIARRELFTNSVPSVPGGGTVAYVNDDSQVYLDDPEHREEGGTPDIIGSIRAGLVFQLKEAVGPAAIKALEERFVHTAVHHWEAHPNIDVLGNHDADRLSIVSFVVRNAGPGSGGPHRWLHHNFVVALLNDLFGVQSRGGCSCAGPYGHRLLGLDIETSLEFRREITGGCEGIKPGWVRVNFNYFFSDDVFRFILDAVDFVATHGWRLLPLYELDAVSGLWVHVDGRAEPPLSLHDVAYVDGQLTFPTHRRRTLPDTALKESLEEAHRIVDQLGARPLTRPPTPPTAGVSADFESLRWFPLPHEVVQG